LSRLAFDVSCLWADTYAAFFSPDNAPRIFFIQAEKR
jgi:hypothetical protein